MDCLFCKIISGEIPGAIVYQDDRLVAFKDINPQAPMHVLIVPRRHIATLNDLAPEDDALVGEMARRAAALAKENGYADPAWRAWCQIGKVKGTQQRDRSTKLPGKRCRPQQHRFCQL